MTNREWIICERSGRWAAALRMAASRRVYPAGVNSAARPRLLEVRSLDELTAILDERRHAIAFVEVRQTNLAATLIWLAGASPAHPHTRCIALLEKETSDGKYRDDVIAALWAAGAVEICQAPRHVQRVLTLAQQHTASQASKATGFDASQSIADWAEALLPWQSAARQVG